MSAIPINSDAAATMMYGSMGPNINDGVLNNPNPNVEIAQNNIAKSNMQLHEAQKEQLRTDNNYGRNAESARKVQPQGSLGHNVDTFA